MRRPLKALVISASLLLPAAALADSLTIPIISTSVDSATAVINPVTSDAHPPLQVKDWGNAAPLSTTAFSVGDGSDGAFSPATYLNFDNGTYAGDHVIHIDTDAHPVLNFTSFDLQASWKIQPTGSKPLIIRNLSTVSIAGDIDCSGNRGSDVGIVTSTVAGGLGRCGGSNGGNGASSTVNATAGSQPSTNASVASGGPGLPQGDGDGGGGGAGMDATAAPTAGVNGSLDAGGGGTAGTSDTDSAFTKVGGGAGGGGGAAFTDPSAPAAASSGAGGGAGGGSIYIYSVGNITINGHVLVDGGAGGGSSGVGKGGGGGGGAGGSILIFSGGAITINGIVRAYGGAGGVTPGGHGGAGGQGRTWVTDNDGVPTMGPGATLDPLGLLAQWGTITFQIGPFTVTSNTFDLDNSSPLLTNVAAASTLTAGSTVSFEIASSDQPFAASDATWFPASSVYGRKINRYVRVRLTINNQDLASAARVSSVTLTFTPNVKKQFEFASCGVTKGRGPGGPANLITLFLLLIPLAVALRLRRRVATSSPVYQPYPK